MVMPLAFVECYCCCLSLSLYIYMYIIYKVTELAERSSLFQYGPLDRCWPGALSLLFFGVRPTRDCGPTGSATVRVSKTDDFAMVLTSLERWCWILQAMDVGLILSREIGRGRRSGVRRSGAIQVHPLAGFDGPDARPGGQERKVSPDTYLSICRCI